MKKLLLTLAIVLGMGMYSFAGEDNTQGGGGLFGYGEKIYDRETGDRTPMLPNHGETENQDGDAPLGSGIALLAGLGAAYLVGKRRNED